MRAHVIGPKPFGDVSQAPTPANGYISHHPGLTTTGFQARSKDQEILEEGGGAGPSLLPRRDHE